MKGHNVSNDKDSEEKRYEELGFMCGLEIHQRLATSEKLFCDCSATLEELAPEYEIERRQRAVAGELGDIDRSAKFEELKARSFKYKLSEGHACLVDIDEEPPHIMNRQALDISLKLAASMNMKVMPELEPMRKEVVDGSNPSAFQRSTLVGLNGKITVNGNDIPIPTMFLEEESAGIISNSESSAVYDTSRIGIPLVEIDTFPYIKTPKDVKDVALHIGTMLRLTGAVQRGIGSIRQDVNVSIRGGSRVEIKGLQELYDMDKFVENEVKRQIKLIEIIKLLKSRKAEVSTELKDVTKALSSSESKIISSSIRDGGSVMGFKLKNFAGVLGMEVNPERRLGTEISDYAKMAGVKGIIHGDEDMAKYRISDSELSAIKEILEVEKGDTFIMVTGKNGTAVKAAELAMERARLAMEVVPPETRAMSDRDLCTTRFMRPLPGGSRMYPETDTRPITITKEMLDEAASGIISVEKELKELEADIGDADMAKRMLMSPRLQLYKHVSSFKDADKRLIANTIMQKFTEMKRDGIDVDSLSPSMLKEIFMRYAAGDITKQALDALIRLAAKGSTQSIGEMIKSNALDRIKGKELSALLKKEGYDANMENKEKEYFIKSFMQKYRLNIDGSELMELTH